jgi:hypothetical protein
MVFAGEPSAVNSVDGWNLFLENRIDETRLVGEEIKQFAFMEKNPRPALRPIHMSSHAIRTQSAEFPVKFYVTMLHYEVARLVRNFFRLGASLAAPILGRK